MTVTEQIGSLCYNPESIYLAHDRIVWVKKVLENKASDAAASCCSGQGGRLKCNQIISQGCLGFTGIA